MFVARLAWLLVLASVAALVVGRFGTRCDACDIVNIGFPLWFAGAVTGLVILSIFSFRGSRKWRSLIAIAVLAVVAAQRPPMPVATGCEFEGDAGRLKIVSFNAWMNNPQPTLAAAWIKQERPDVVVLVEAKGGAAPLPVLLARDFPYQVACLAKLPCSTRILSRHRPTMVMPLGQGDVENRKGLSAVALSLMMPNGRNVTIIGVHLSRPLPLGQQRRELARLRDRLSGIDPTMVIAGDFNASRDSMMLGSFAEDNLLGRVPTGSSWPARAADLPLPSVLAIDHIFVGRHVGLGKSGVGPEIGSDHRPVFGTLCVKNSG